MAGGPKSSNPAATSLTMGSTAALLPLTAQSTLPWTCCSPARVGDRLVELGVLHPNLIHPPIDFPMTNPEILTTATWLLTAHLFRHGVITAQMSRHTTTPITVDCIPIDLEFDALHFGEMLEPYFLQRLPDGQPRLHRSKFQPHPACVLDNMPDILPNTYGQHVGIEAGWLALEELHVNQGNHEAIDAFFGDDEFKLVHLAIRPNAQVPAPRSQARRHVRQGMLYARGIWSTPVWAWDEGWEQYLLPNQLGSLEECLRGLRMVFEEDDYEWARGIDEAIGIWNAVGAEGPGEGNE